MRYIAFIIRVYYINTAYCLHTIYNVYCTVRLDRIYCILLECILYVYMYGFLYVNSI